MQIAGAPSHHFPWKLVNSVNTSLSDQFRTEAVHQSTLNLLQDSFLTTPNSQMHSSSRIHPFQPQLNSADWQQFQFHANSKPNESTVAQILLPYFLLFFQTLIQSERNFVWKGRNCRLIVSISCCYFLD